MGKPHKVKVKSQPSGFAAMGAPIPYSRRQAAYDAAKSMGVAEAFAIVDGMAEQLQRDKPFEAMVLAQRYVDVTGSYRLMAHLLTDARRRNGIQNVR